LGLKNIKHEIRFLANDDTPTPTALIGKKAVPIFELPGSDGQPGVVMPESLDIIRYIDSDDKYGPTGYFKPMSDRKDIKEWQSKVADVMRIFQRPRYMQSFLPEFQQQDGKEAFVYNHPMPPYEKKEWKEKLSRDERWGAYDSAFTQSLELTDEVSRHLVELNELIYCDSYATEGGISIDDIDLWSRLRSVTLCKGVVWPDKLRKYMDNLALDGDLMLYDGIAI